jgi:hypothetical protein
LLVSSLGNARRRSHPRVASPLLASSGSHDVADHVSNVIRVSGWFVNPLPAQPTTAIARGAIRFPNRLPPVIAVAVVVVGAEGGRRVAERRLGAEF